MEETGDMKKSRVVLYGLFIILSYAVGYYTGVVLKPPIRPNIDHVHTIVPAQPTSCKCNTSTSRSYESITHPGPMNPEKPRQPSTVNITDSDLFRYSGRCAEPVPVELVRETVVDAIFNGTDPYLNFPPAHLQPLLHQHNLWGWGSQGPVFERLVRRVEPRIIIEIGSFLGASAIHMANISKELGLRPLILCVDDFRGFPGMTNEHRLKYVNGDITLLHQFMYNVKRANFDGTILPMPFSTNAVLWQLCSMGVTGDLIEVDAAHDFHSAWNDINLAYRLLTPGGVLFGHDYFTKFGDYGVRRAVNLFAKVKGMRVRPDGNHWVLETN